MGIVNKLIDMTFKNKSFMKLFYYGIFGVTTTVINLAVFWALDKIGVYYMVNACMAWIVAVLFAYISNRKLVFDSTAKHKKDVFKEMIRFYIGRVATLLINIGGLYVFVDLLKSDKMISQIIMNVFVIFANYFFSKITIMSHKGQIAEVNVKENIE